ncbi:MAG: cupredoxin domain-containing protein [Caldimonas sp.]|uniref:cupredoxin domain-containing protein n=1 Tax=Caldimonas sp. TaxID=2838790 RepID=UPI00391BE5CE
MQNVAHALALAGLLLVPAAAAAHGDRHHDGRSGPVVMEQKPWGIAGQAKAVKRTIEIKMTDDMRFTPAEIEVKRGETIRFIHHNSGKVMHEFVLGTRRELEEHAALMKKFPDMEHDEPYMAHVPPGKTAEMIWHFNRVGEFEFACLLPGHFDAGMVGRIRVVQR